MASTQNQVRHDIINLHKTIKLLEDTVNNEDWKQFTPGTQTTKWLKAQTVIGGVRHCRSMLSTLPDGDYSVGVRDVDLIVNDAFVDKINRTLAQLEHVATEANELLQPRPKKLGLTSNLPRPRPKVVEQVDKPESKEVEVVVQEKSQEDITNVQLAHEDSIVHNLLDPIESEPIPKTDPVNPSFTLLSPSAPPSTTSTKATSTPAFLKTSTALHDDLAGQLAQMAEQLKRNAIHFSESLEKDKAVLKDAEEKLDVNYDSLGKERVRLRDHRGKSSGTTCLVIMSIVVVLISFIVMLFVIRVT